MQGTQVRALVREDPTCRGATKPMRHNYWVCAPQLLSLCSRAHEPQVLSLCATTTEARVPRAHALQQEKPLQCGSPRTTTKSNPCSLQLEEAHVQQQRPNAAKNK